MRDFQARTVYDWENKYISPLDKYEMSFDEIQDFVEFVWANLGRSHPPRIKVGRKNSNRATGYRLALTFPDKSFFKRRSIVLHELAHALLEDRVIYDDDWQIEVGHGPKFVKIYADLLEKFMCLPKEMLWYSLKEAGLNIEARAVDADVVLC